MEKQSTHYIHLTEPEKIERFALKNYDDVQLNYHIYWRDYGNQL